jgi:hypothetical protein
MFKMVLGAIVILSRITLSNGLLQDLYIIRERFDSCSDRIGTSVIVRAEI